MNFFIKALIGLFAFTTLLISGYALVFVVLGMLPTIVAVFIDKRITRAASNTIGGFNLLGIMPYLLKMFRAGIGASDLAHEVLTDINTWFVVYSSAGIGWVIIWIIPQVAGNFFISREEKRIGLYKEEQTKILEEWGNTIKNYGIKGVVGKKNNQKN